MTRATGTTKRGSVGWLRGLPLAASLFFALGTALCAQQVTLTGTLNAANGLPARNWYISLTPTQWFYIAGTTTVVNTPIGCATSVDGSIVGLLNPLNPPVTSVVYTGTLPAGNYYARIAWYDGAGNVTLVGPEVATQLAGAGRLQVSPPASGKPAAAVGMRVYIGTTAGGETLQGSTTGTATFLQSTPLVVGAALPSTNTTLCKPYANDAGWPSFTGYDVSMTSPTTGATLPGYPMVWRLLGAGTTINLSNGLPLYNGQVIYPVPLLAQPPGHNPQSVSSPLSMTGYPLTNVGALGVGTGTPGWGVDVEGAGTAGQINAAAGYLLNGVGGAAGQCMVSDGTAFDLLATCLTPTTAEYQTIQVSGTPVAQEPKLNLIPQNGVTASCVDNAGATRTDCTLQLNTAVPQSVMSCGTSAACANTVQTLPRAVWGNLALAAGTVTVTGITPPFTSTSSFGCVGTDQTSAAAVKIAIVSTSSITITGTGTDTVTWQCTGN